MSSDQGRVEVDATASGILLRFYGPRGGYLASSSLPLGNVAAFRALLEAAEQESLERMAEREAGELTAVPELGTH